MEDITASNVSNIDVSIPADKPGDRGSVQCIDIDHILILLHQINLFNWYHTKYSWCQSCAHVSKLVYSSRIQYEPPSFNMFVRELTVVIERGKEYQLNEIM